MNLQKAELITLLKNRFVELQTRNSSYSFRAFSKKLGIGASTLSMVLSGHRQCSKKLAIQIADRLLLDPIERASVLSQYAPGAKRVKKRKPDHLIQYLKITADQYAAYSDSFHVAILNLLHLKNFKNDALWIARRIGATPPVARAALERLKRLEMIVEDDQGKLSRNHPSYRTTDDVANLSLKKAHFQQLDVLRNSLEGDPLEERDFSMLTFVVQQSRMKEMKEWIRRFENEFFYNLVRMLRRMRCTA